LSEISVALEIVDIKSFIDGDLLVESEFLQNIEGRDWSQFQDKMVLIRGCSDIIIPTWAYMSVTAKLAGFAKSIRYGNEHSNLVIYRRPKEQ
jgi:Protein of unknown function (DUF2480)